jgi:hypothetical protein
VKYLTKVLLGLDQFANTIIGGAPDETISARAGRQALANTKMSHLIWRPLAWTLNTLQPEHVQKAICHERDGSQQDPAYRDVYDKDDLCAPK